MLVFVSVETNRSPLPANSLTKRNTMIAALDTMETVRLFQETGMDKKQAEANTTILRKVQEEIITELVSKEYLDLKIG